MVLVLVFVPRIIPSTAPKPEDNKELQTRRLCNVHASENVSFTQFPSDSHKVDWLFEQLNGGLF